jgi:hypothetical protein
MDDFPSIDAPEAQDRADLGNSEPVGVPELPDQLKGD